MQLARGMLLHHEQPAGLARDCSHGLGSRVGRSLGAVATQVVGLILVSA